MASRRRWTTLPSFDDRLTAELERAARPADPTGVLERVSRRRSRRAALRKVQAGLLAVAVLAATAGGFVFLRHAFDRNPRGTGEAPELPTNGEIVFSRQGEDGRFHLFASHPDGTGIRQITQGTTNDSDPSVSPDGTLITFVQTGDEPYPRISTTTFDGTTPPGRLEPMGSASVSSEPTWSPVDDRIVYKEPMEPDGMALLISEVDSGDGYVLYRSPPGGDIAGASWSPDGGRLAFAVTDSSGSNRSWDIATIRSDGTDLRLIAETRLGGTGAAWSPDGSRIAFLRDQGHEIWIMSPDGSDKQLLASVEAFLEPDLAWVPGGTALLVSDGDWIYGVDAMPGRDPSESLVRIVRGASPVWRRLPANSEPSPAAETEPSLSPSPSPVPDDSDIGLGFNVCNLAVLSGIDFLGDETDGTAWTATKVKPNGKCPSTYDGTNGVAVDFTGDGEADSWSETIEHCTMCGPFMARDLNEDGAEEVIITLQGGSIMQYGIYTVMPLDAKLQIVPFTTGEPGHHNAGHAVGEPFTFWVGGDEGSSYWFHCEALPDFRLTDTYTPVDGGPDAETTVHETHVSLGTDGIAHILDAQTYTVVGEVDLQYATSKPDCGLGVDIWRLQAP